MRADGDRLGTRSHRHRLGATFGPPKMECPAGSYNISPLAIRTRPDPPGFHRALTVIGPRSGHHHVSLRTDDGGS